MSDLATIGAYSIFIGSYIVFALGKFPGMKIDRPGAAVIGAVLMFTVGAVRASDALHFIHFGTVVLLFSMMLVVAYLHLAGFFDWITELVVTRLKPQFSPWRPISARCRRPEPALESTSRKLLRDRAGWPRAPLPQPSPLQ